MAIPLYTTGSLSPTFVPAPPVGVAVKLPSAFALCEWFPTILREPLSASDTLSEATAPVKLPAWHCPTAGSRRLVRNPILQGWYPNSGSTKTDLCVCHQGEILQRIQTQGINPFHQSADEIAVIVSEVSQQLSDRISIHQIERKGCQHIDIPKLKLGQCYLSADSVYE